MWMIWFFSLFFRPPHRKTSSIYLLKLLYLKGHKSPQGKKIAIFSNPGLIFRTSDIRTKAIPRSILIPQCAKLPKTKSHLKFSQACQLFLRLVGFSIQYSSVQSLSHVQLFGLHHSRFSVHHQLPKLTQTHVHQVSDAIQPPYPLSYPSPPTLNLSQHQGLFQ